jgi:hypothetical protein
MFALKIATYFLKKLIFTKNQWNAFFSSPKSVYVDKLIKCNTGKEVINSGLGSKAS